MKAQLVAFLKGLPLIVYLGVGLVAGAGGWLHLNNKAQREQGALEEQRAAALSRADSLASELAQQHRRTAAADSARVRAQRAAVRDSARAAQSYARAQVLAQRVQLLADSLVRIDAGPPVAIPAAVGAELASLRAAAADLNAAVATKSRELATANAQLASRDAELVTARAELAARVTAADVGAKIEKPPWWRRAIGQVTVIGSAAAGAGLGVLVGGPAGAVAGAALGAAVGSLGR